MPMEAMGIDISRVKEETQAQATALQCSPGCGGPNSVSGVCATGISNNRTGLVIL